MSSTAELFARHNLRLTPQRRALFEALEATRTHPTAEELYQLVKPLISHLSRATVYNTLETLCAVGLARKLPSSGCCRYDADTTEHMHLCFREDGSIQDVPGDLGLRLAGQLPRATIAEIEQRLGVRIDGVNVQLMARRRSPDRAVGEGAVACRGSAASGSIPGRGR